MMAQVQRWRGMEKVSMAAQFTYGDTSHSGASTIRKQLHNWQPSRAAADADIHPDLPMLVARARDLGRNNGLAAGSLQTLSDNVIGFGLRLACNPNWRALGKSIQWKEEWSRKVEGLWQAYSESCAIDAAYKLNFAAMSQLVWRSVLENGEALALPLWLERPDSRFRTCLQIVDTDRLSNPSDQLPSDTIRGGIELDRYGRPRAYHIQKNQTWLGWYPILGIFSEWERIPAQTEWGRPRVLHIFQQDRADQTRGKPILTPVIEQFRMLDSYQRTELQSAIVNALVAGVIETPMDAAGIADLVNGDPSGYLEKKGEYRPQLEGGTFIPLYPGDKLEPYTPARPSGQYATFVESIIRQIGAAMGLPYELTNKDYSKVTYASARASLGEAWRFFANRRMWIADNWATPVYALWLEEAVNQKLVEAPGFYENREFYTRSNWIGPGRNQIDPVKEAQASMMRIQNRTSTLELECAEMGLDWNEVLDQLALERERMEQLDFAPPEAATRPSEEKDDDEEDAKTKKKQEAVAA